MHYREKIKVSSNGKPMKCFSIFFTMKKKYSVEQGLCQVKAFISMTYLQLVRYQVCSIVYRSLHKGWYP